MIRKKRNIIAAALALLACVVVALSVGSVRATGRKLDSLKQNYEQMAAISDEFTAMKKRVDLLENRKKFTRGKGVLTVLDQTVTSLNLKDKLKSQKELVSQSPNDKKVEAVFNGLNMNEAVNLLYSIENTPLLLIVRQVKMKKSFENQNLLNVTITLSLIVPE